MRYKEEVVDGVKELKEGEMKIFAVDNHEVLITRVGNDYFATAAYCPHYGAPLDKGILNGSRLVCPWHHSCFEIKTGELEEPPALHSLTKLEVIVEKTEVKIRIPQHFTESILPKMVSHDPKGDNRNYVIIGGGAAGVTAAQSLREAGYKGKIKIITRENRYPYDRPNLSKSYLSGQAGEDWMPLHPDKFYKSYGIDILFEKVVKDIDVPDKSIFFENGESMHFDKLLIASGGTPKKLNVPGSDLTNIFTLRSYDSCNEIINAANKASHIAVVGASFIGMETAFSLHERTHKSVTVIAPEEIPFENMFGNEIGNLFKKKHEEYGTKFRLKEKIAGFEGSEKVSAVILENGEKIKADMVLIGIGVKPATDFLQDIDLLSDGSIEVDKHFKAFNNVFAAGDIASFPDWRTGKIIRIEHWRTAEQQGKVAGFNMAGKKVEYISVPFFWTRQVGLNLRYVGYTNEWDEILYDGDVSSENFIAYYIKDNEVLASAGNNKDREMAAISELMRMDRLPVIDTIRNHEFNPIRAIRKKEFA